jgi:ABC-type arginine/histidine transport system permease subunit
MAFFARDSLKAIRGGIQAVKFCKTNACPAPGLMMFHEISFPKANALPNAAANSG